MAEVNSQVVRRTLIGTVADYDDSIVTRKALADSTEFIAFLNKKIGVEEVDLVGYADIINELEEKLGVTIPEKPYKDWQQLFDKLTKLLNKG